MIRVAIIGAGIGAEHLAGYRILPDRFQVSVLCDLDTDRARQATSGDAAIALSADIDTVLSDETLDLIDVCLPPHLHLPVSVLALQAGKHVICEKPLVRSLHEADQLQSAATASGKQVFPVFQYRYGPATSQLAALQAAGLAGKVYVASIETHWNRAADYYEVPWRGTWKGEAGGAVLGHAIHAHDLLSHILGPVTEVFAFSDTRVNRIQTEDCVAISFRMRSGALATSSITLGAGDDTTRLRFCFEGFTAESGASPYAPAADTWQFTARSPTRQAQIDAVLAEVPDARAGFAGYLEAVANALANRGGGEVTLAEGRRSIELVTAIYASARDGRSISLPLARGSAFYNGWAQ